MTTTTSLPRRAFGPVVAGDTWRSTLKVFFDLPVVWITGLIVLIPAAVAIPTLPVFPLAAVCAWFALVANRYVAHFHRFLIEVFLDRPIRSPFRPRPSGRWYSPVHHWRLLSAEITDPASWRALAHRVIAIPGAAVAAVVTLLAWCVPFAGLTSAGWVWALPGDRIDIGPLHATGWLGVAGATALGAALLPLAPLVMRGIASADRGLGSLLLGPRTDEELVERIEEVEESRTRVVDAAEAERRRIERDLHDGAQQRLVALAMNLGMAKEKFPNDPEAASALIDEAHAEAKRALVELRDLARGLHPAVLTDRGLGPALSAVAARSAVPVTVEVQLIDRLDEATEGIAYFVVCEALTNVAKHSDATTARVLVARRGDRLVVEITDDGRGGADPTSSGLRGLRDRVEGVDGWFHVASPEGGPTTITAELPCA